MQSSAWEREMNKMVNREVTVSQFVGTDARGNPLWLDHSGICVAIQHQHLSVILMTEDEKITIKNVALIRRRRTKNNAPKPEPTVADLGEVLKESMKGAPE